jgi:diguanylate cyclase (GGDEF)-like protein/PAS domain S-box-containing protein
MIAPPTPREPERIAALHRTGLLDTEPERAFDELTELAAQICGVPLAVVTLVDTERIWFKSKFGMEGTEIGRDHAFCAHAIHDSAPLIVPDAAADPRFHDTPLVAGSPWVRFYAGYPLADPAGFNLGTLCVLDRRPRELTAEQSRALDVLARQVSTLIALRIQMRIAEEEIARRRQVEEQFSASEQRFRAFMDYSPAIAFIKDDAGRYTFVNRIVCTRFDLPEEKWLGKTDRDIFAPDVARSLREMDLKVLECGQGVKTLEYVPTDGRMTVWNTLKFPMPMNDGRIFLAGIGIEITAEVEAEAATRQSEEKFRSVIEGLAEGVYLIDNRDGRVVEANSALTTMLGYSKEELARLRARDLFTGEDEDTIRRTDAEARTALASNGRYSLGRRLYRRKNGEVLDVFVQLGYVPQGERGLTSVIVRDITEQRRYEERLEAYQRELEQANAALRTLATTDSLTGARNRAAFDQRLAHELDRTQRYGRPLSLLLLDVDHFKPFNDTFGHPAGDEVLRTVASILQRAIRETDFFARYGGEEFAAILPETDRAGALGIAERCRRMVAEHPWPKRAITISVGSGTVAGAEAEAGDLLDDADLALYRSKRYGRNRVTQAEPNPPDENLQ